MKNTHSRIIGGWVMINYWPEGLDPKYYDQDQKTVIKIHERIRQLEDVVKKLKESKK